MPVSYWQQAYISYIGCLQKLSYKDNILKLKQKQCKISLSSRRGYFSVGRNKTAGKEGQLRLGHSQGKTYGVTVHLMWLTKEILCFGSPLGVWSFIAI